MFLRIKRITPILIASTGAVALSKDVKDTVQVQENKTDETKRAPDAYDKSTGWERVKLIFQVNEYGERSPDFALIATAAFTGTMIGLIMGAKNRNRKTVEEFLEKNDASKFQNLTEARRELARLTTKEMLKGVWQYAPRLAFIFGGFTLVSTTVAAYRGKTGILENITAGVVMGTLYRFNYGFRGMLAGATLGSVYGLFFGATHYLFSTILGVDIEGARKDFHNFYYYGDRKLKKTSADIIMRDEMDPLDREGSIKHSKLPLTLDHIDDAAKEAA